MTQPPRVGTKRGWVPRGLGISEGRRRRGWVPGGGNLPPHRTGGTSIAHPPSQGEALAPLMVAAATRGSIRRRNPIPGSGGTAKRAGPVTRTKAAATRGLGVCLSEAGAAELQAMCMGVGGGGQGRNGDRGAVGTGRGYCQCPSLALVPRRALSLAPTLSGTIVGRAGVLPTASPRSCVGCCRQAFSSATMSARASETAKKKAPFALSLPFGNYHPKPGLRLARWGRCLTW